MLKYFSWNVQRYQIRSQISIEHHKFFLKRRFFTYRVDPSVTRNLKTLIQTWLCNFIDFYTFPDAKRMRYVLCQGLENWYKLNYLFFVKNKKIFITESTVTLDLLMVVLSNRFNVHCCFWCCRPCFQIKLKTTLWKYKCWSNKIWYRFASEMFFEEICISIIGNKIHFSLKTVLDMIIIRAVSLYHWVLPLPLSLLPIQTWIFKS